MAKELEGVRPTRYAELGYKPDGPRNWRLVWMETGNTVGPNYTTKEELLADLSAQYEARCNPPRHWSEDLLAKLVALVNHFEKTAPTVAEWANALYIKIGDNPDEVRLSELVQVEALYGDGRNIEAPNLAANRVYKLMNRLGQDTTGHAGF